MTLGFGVAAWSPEIGCVVAVVSDSRLLDGGMTLSDAGVKTYALGGRTGMGAAGHALPAISAADIVREIVEVHNQANAKPMGFYDTTRLLAFFLKRACEVTNKKTSLWTNAVLVGFLDSGRPCLAQVTVSATKNSVRFFSVEEGESLMVPVGSPGACVLLLQGFCAALNEGRPVIQAGVSLIRYMSQLPVFPTIGGGISIGTCRVDHSSLSWPHILIDGRRYLRGIDVTDYARPTWPAAEKIDYDETWCANLDLRLNRDQSAVEEPLVVPGCFYEIDSLSSPDSLFQLHDDPDAFGGGVACPK